MAKLTMVEFLSHVDQNALDDLALRFSGRKIGAKMQRAVERGYLTRRSGAGRRTGWRVTDKGRARMRRTGPPEPPHNWPTMFAQDYWWRSRSAWTEDGWIPVKDMSLAHKANTVAWLERNADYVIARLISILDRLAWSMALYSPGGEMAADALDQALDETQDRWGELVEIHKAGKASQWIRSTEIYRRLTADVTAGRGREED